MQSIRILSWNVNGIRAVHKKDFVKWVQTEQPDILMLQETKAEKEQLPAELLQIPGYHSYWSHSIRKKGYSGTGIYTKFLPEKISSGIGLEQFDNEGRTLVAEYGDLMIFNIYFPNGKASPERLKHKMEFYEAFQKRAMAEVKKRQESVGRRRREYRSSSHRSRAPS